MISLWRLKTAQEEPHLHSPQQSWSENDLLSCHKYLPAHPSLFCLMQRNPSIHLHKDSACIRSMMSWRGPLFGPHSLFYEPVWDQGNSRRPKESAKEPSLCGHNRSSCKAFGKSVTTKEHSGLSQTPALCPPPRRLTHQLGGGDGDGRERKRNMFGLQISQNIGYDPLVGCEKTERGLPPEVMRMIPQTKACTTKNEGSWRRKTTIFWERFRFKYVNCDV